MSKDLTNLIHEEPKAASFNCGELTIRAMSTGDPDRRGEIVITISNWDEEAHTNLTISDARRVAEQILEFADICERFSTRGYVGSKE